MYGQVCSTKYSIVSVATIETQSKISPDPSTLYKGRSVIFHSDGTNKYICSRLIYYSNRRFVSITISDFSIDILRITRVVSL